MSSPAQPDPVSIRSLNIASLRELLELLELPSSLRSLGKADLKAAIEARVHASTIDRPLIEELRQRKAARAAADEAASQTPEGEEGTSGESEASLSQELTDFLARIHRQVITPVPNPPGDNNPGAAQLALKVAERNATFAARLAKEREQQEQEEREFAHYKAQHGRPALVAPPSASRPAFTGPTDTSAAQLLASALAAALTSLSVPAHTLSGPSATATSAALAASATASRAIPVCPLDPEAGMGIQRAPFDATVLAAIQQGTQADIHKLLQPLAAPPSDMPEHAMVLDSATNTFKPHARTIKPHVQTLLDLVDAHMNEIRLLTRRELVPDRLAFLRRILTVARIRGVAAAIQYASLVRATRLQRPEATTDVAERVLDGHAPDIYSTICAQHPLLSLSAVAPDSARPRGHIPAGHSPPHTRAGRDPASSTCHNWNGGVACAKGEHCPYAHRCNHCDADAHRRRDCPTAPPLAARTPRQVVKKTGRSVAAPPAATPSPAAPGGAVPPHQ